MEYPNQSLPSVQKAALCLLEQARAAERSLGMSCAPENRTAEFLLLIRRLSAILPWPVQRFLEVGCGSAYSLRLWSETAESVTGIDLAPAITAGRRLLAALTPPRNGILLRECPAEEYRNPGQYDLILSQYVLEHVRDMSEVLARVRENLAPGGVAVHVVNGTASRAAWYMQYREAFSFPRRLYYSLRDRGVFRTVTSPFGHTTPHEPRFGDFGYELEQYRLDSWSLRMLSAGFEVTEWFQTSDLNHVIVTRPIP
jgi:SAM-dependent methyltransferase